MKAEINSVIINGLKFLKLSKAGEIRLAVFSDKVIYKARNLVQKRYKETPSYPFNTFFSACLIETKRLNIEPNWNAMEELGLYKRYDNESSVTLLNEKFDMQECIRIKKEFKDISTQYHKVVHGKTVSFTRGLEYWKYGYWYKYPDQAIDEHTCPTQPDSTYTPLLDQNHPSRLDTGVIEELEKAIRSGKINEKGLSLLSNIYSTHNPEIANIVKAYVHVYDEPQLAEDQTILI